MFTEVDSDATESEPERSPRLLAGYDTEVSDGPPSPMLLTDYDINGPPSPSLLTETDGPPSPSLLSGYNINGPPSPNFLIDTDVPTFTQQSPSLLSGYDTNSPPSPSLLTDIDGPPSPSLFVPDEPYSDTNVYQAVSHEDRTEHPFKRARISEDSLPSFKIPHLPPGTLKYDEIFSDIPANQRINLHVEHPSRFSAQKDFSTKFIVNLVLHDKSGTITVEQDHFKGHPTLESVAINLKQAIIKKHAFADCRRLRKLDIVTNFVEIESGTFRGCTSLTEIVFFNDAAFHEDAFSGCINLKTIVFPPHTTLLKTVFSNCPSITDVVVPNELLLISESGKTFISPMLRNAFDSNTAHKVIYAAALFKIELMGPPSPAMLTTMQEYVPIPFYNSTFFWKTIVDNMFENKTITNNMFSGTDSHKTYATLSTKELFEPVKTSTFMVYNRVFTERVKARMDMLLFFLDWSIDKTPDQYDIYSNQTNLKKYDIRHKTNGEKYITMVIYDTDPDVLHLESFYFLSDFPDVTNTGRTASGIGMELVKLFAITMKIKSIRLQDAWQSRRSYTSSVHLKQDANDALNYLLDNKFESGKEGAIKMVQAAKKAGFKSNENIHDFIKRIEENGYYGKWNFKTTDTAHDILHADVYTMYDTTTHFK